MNCKERTVVYVDLAEHTAWKEGAPIQQAFPNMSAEVRELLITGIHSECWLEMFPPEDGDIYETYEG